MPSDLTVFNDQILFSGNDAHGQTGLWATDGTAAGTHELSGITGASTTGIGLDPTGFTVFGDRALFSGYDTSGQLGLWETDGTTAGTHELSGIAGASTTGIGLHPSDFVVYNEEVLFSGNDAHGQTGLWETDGTAAGTHELSGITGASTTGTGLAPTDFTVFNGHVLFSGNDAHGQTGLWETDGTAAGTHELTAVVGASSLTGLAPYGLTPIGTPVLTAGASAKLVVGGPPVALDAGLSISDGEFEQPHRRDG